MHPGPQHAWLVLQTNVMPAFGNPSGMVQHGAEPKMH